MKSLFIIAVAAFIFVACRKDDEKNGRATVANPLDTTYTPPTNITRYTRQMAGTWHWKGYYEDHYVQHDSEGVFNIVLINDSTLRFRESVFYYELRDRPADSNFLISYIDTSLSSSKYEVAGIHFYYKDDTIVYDKWWGPYYRLRLYANTK